MTMAVDVNLLNSLGAGEGRALAGYAFDTLPIGALL